MKNLFHRRRVMPRPDQERGCFSHGASNPQRSLTRKPGGTTNCRRHHCDGEHAKEILFHKKASSCSGPEGEAMQVVHSCCAGLDVHKKSVYACVIRCDDDGRKHQQIRTFSTMTQDLLALG